MKNDIDYFFYIPFLYSYITRVRSIDKLVSWIIIYVIPVLYFAVYLQAEYTIRNISIGIICITLIYTIYEIGYIENDTETIKNETNPTLRLHKNELEYYEKYKIIIYTSRILLSIFLSAVIYFLSKDVYICIIALILSCLLLVIFYIYNQIRNILNLFLQIILVTLRYSSGQFLFYENFNGIIFLLSIFAFPVTDFIERAADIESDRFHQKWAQVWVRDIGVFRYRVFYYLLINILLLPLYHFHFFSFKEHLIFIYYLLYRTLIYIRYGHGIKRK